MLVCIFLVVIGGSLANEYIIYMPLFGWLDTVLKVRCIFALWVFIVLLITGVVIYIFRDKNAILARKAKLRRVFKALKKPILSLFQRL